MRQLSPFTDTGALQAEISNIERQLSGKVDAHELHQIRADLDRLEHTVREMGTALALVRDGLQVLQENTVKEAQP